MERDELEKDETRPKWRKARSAGEERETLAQQGAEKARASLEKDRWGQKAAGKGRRGTLPVQASPELRWGGGRGNGHPTSRRKK